MRGVRMSTRHQQRAHFDEQMRLFLLENDADDFEQGLQQVIATLNRILWTLVGLLITITTGVLLMLAGAIGGV